MIVLAVRALQRALVIAHRSRTMREAPGTAWYRQVWPRYCRLFWLKSIGTSLIMTLFFAGYFHVLRHPVYPLITMPMTFVDALVPFFPPSLLVYASLWVYVVVPPSMLLGFRELVAYGFWITGLCLAGLASFYFWPTTLSPQLLDRGQSWGFEFLSGIDAAANACPSLHVATAVFSCFWFNRVLKEMNVGCYGRAFNVFWCFAIAYSTMSTKQHVFLDVLAGFALGAAFALLSLWHRKGVSWAAWQRGRSVKARGDQHRVVAAEGK